MSRQKKAAAIPPLADRQKPGLSVTLTGPRDPRLCQNCAAAHHPGNELARWLEHDEWDKVPLKPVVVVLCEQCSKRFIEPHPRLYERLQNGAPFPGCMSVCVNCTLRDGASCTSPTAKLNGGPGLMMRWAKEPVSAHLNFGGGRGRWMHVFDGPVIACSGREVRA